MADSTDELEELDLKSLADSGTAATFVTLQIMDLKRRMRKVEEGVSNFRAFQSDNREFMAIFKEREAQREKIDKRRATIHFTLLSALLAMVGGCAVALFTFLLPMLHMHK